MITIVAHPEVIGMVRDINLILIVITKTLTITSDVTHPMFPIQLISTADSSSSLELGSLG